MQEHHYMSHIGAMSWQPGDPKRYALKPKEQTHRYSKWMSVDAAEDPRLGHGAVRLLQLIRCLSGRATHLETTRASLGARINRHMKSVGRYLRELVKFGYLRITHRTNGYGMVTGLYIYLTAKVLPKFKDKRPARRRKLAGTEPSHINVESLFNNSDLSTREPVNKDPDLTDALLSGLLTTVDSARRDGKRLKSHTLTSLAQLVQDSLIHRAKAFNEST